ncbi:MAG: efflux RND transporter periplasmic adaptor subunit [Rickettsiales bacterium]|jgi:HlyD family secretion protein|nr:efflux RND transporter periplasmic adaptor subunit [Rickettsiales bacterium]
MIKIKNWIKCHKILSVLVALIIALLIALLFVPDDAPKKSEYSTIAVQFGNIKKVVTATGEIKPVNTILVGSQVSGNIETIFVDYNSVVKKGDVLLTIDPSVLRATADEAKAALDSATAQLDFDKAEYERNKTLFDEGFIARAELEQSETKYKTSTQSVLRARSQYERAETNLGYTKIVSPVDGTVISRKVDKGQTIAASFQAPDLFEIAEDLSKMQIETSVSEADIGMIAEGQKVSFNVDAYPTQIFDGIVRQVRLSPTTTSNVVVYTVVIDVDNTDLRLMPGMTAFVTIDVESRENVWKVSNAAFLVRSWDGILENVPNGDTPKDTLAIERVGEKNIVFVKYKKGVIASTETEIVAADGNNALRRGDKIIVGKFGQQSKAAGGMPMGGRR